MIIEVCDNCSSFGVVSCDATSCKCDCHYEIDELIKDRIISAKKQSNDNKI